MKKTTTDFTTEVPTKVCTKCGKTKMLEMFRKHKNGYYLGKCYECEKEAWRIRPKKVKADVSTLFPVTTKAGHIFNVSNFPIPGGRKVTSPNTDKVIYTPPEVTRDEARAILQAYANVPRTGISTLMVV